MSEEEKKVMKNFSLEDEELIRAFLFTNPHGNDSFVYPQSLVAGEELSPLMSAYSRTHVPMQVRVLQFLDSEKREQTKAMLPHIRPLMEIFRFPDGTLKISRKTTGFNKEWVLTHGHSSIKEETNLFGHCEHISERAQKTITGHPLSKPQVKSTRYISYGNVLESSLEDEDILSLPDADRFLEVISYMNRKYVEVSDRLADMVFKHQDTKKVVEYLKRPEIVEMEVNKWVEKKQNIDEDYIPKPDELEKQRKRILKGLEDPGVRKAVGKFVFDYSRSYLLPLTRTSLGFSVDARTLEDVLTDMISHPRKEDQKRGQSLWNEAKKVAPVLLGEKSHVNVDMWKVKNEIELRVYAQSRFGNIEARNRGPGTVNLITPQKIEMYTDRFNAALVILPYVDAAFEDIFAQVSEKDVKEILQRAHEYRGEHDVIHPAISHGGLMVEMVMAYHGYRDMYRHRRGSRSIQLLSTRLGFEVPEILKIFGMDDEYMQDMQKCAEAYEEARKFDPHVAEKLVPFGANCRAVHSWQVNQIGYVGKLRTNISRGNLSYVYMARDLMKEMEKIMPETAKYLKWGKEDYPAHLWKKGYPLFDAEMRDK
jgi:thymidylate synthase ThyX